VTQDLKKLGARLASERRQAGLSLDAVGAEVAIHGTTVLRVERGDQASVETLAQIGRVFGLELCWRRIRAREDRT
jgi:transcriptional regulator with XRE-family HTH domain